MVGYGRMCFESVKTLGALHSHLWKRLWPSASAFSTAKNVALLGLYPIHNVYGHLQHAYDEGYLQAHIVDRGSKIKTNM